jgi:hypothetical protein
MSIFKTKIKYPDFLKNLFLENVEWYNTILDKDDGFSNDVHDKMCLTYFNVSIATYFLVNGNYWYNKALPKTYSELDSSQIFTIYYYWL